MENGKDLYFVAVKVFLKNSKNQLLIIKDKFGDWDIPGGRLRAQDFCTSLSNIVKRKIGEELGKKVKYKLGDPVVYMRHERNEILATGKKEKRRIFAVGFEAKYLGGEINLGKNHIKSEWVDLKNFKPGKYFKGGWLKGIKEYIKK